MNLTPVQQQIVDTQGNLIVRASAGTGKTHNMVTFTIKAAQEIKDRLTIDSSHHCISKSILTNIKTVISPCTCYLCISATPLV